MQWGLGPGLEAWLWALQVDRGNSQTCRSQGAFLTFGSISAAAKAVRWTVGHDGISCSKEAASGGHHTQNCPMDGGISARKHDMWDSFLLFSP